MTAIAGPTATAGRGSGRRTREAIAAYLLLAPSFVVFALFFFWPLWGLVHNSLHQKNIQGTAEKWVGTEQLLDTLTGDEFRQGLGVNAKFLLLTVPIGVVLGVLLAMSAHRRLRGIKIFQTIFSSTVASSVAVSAVVFLTIVNPEIGIFRDVGWLSFDRSFSALTAVSLSSIWRNLGLTFVIVLAGLQAVPDEVVEASLLDGYGPFRRFFRITIPLISPTLLFLAVVLTVDAFQAYAQMELLTGGGPAGGTETILFKITRLLQPKDVGEGSAMALGLFVITGLVAAAQFGVLNRRVHYGD
jgi:sn-glycerol 3-phosphate transport system permease protein